MNLTAESNTQRGNCIMTSFVGNLWVHSDLYHESGHRGLAPDILV